MIENIQIKITDKKLNCFAADAIYYTTSLQSNGLKLNEVYTTFEDNAVVFIELDKDTKKEII